MRYLFAHGAGAGMDSSWMVDMDRRLTALGVEVVRFEFPYMAARRRGERRPPDREATLTATWRRMVEENRDAPRLFIGGKSMGGRIATMVADEMKVTGVVCFGYPFHPIGKPQTLRVAHLQNLQTPALFLQGERDELGSREDVAAYDLSASVELHWLTDGDHSLKPRAKSGRSNEENLTEAAEAAAHFMRRA